MAGLLAIIRPADLILLIPSVSQVVKSGAKPKYFLLALFGFLIAVSPQIYAQYMIYGSIFKNYYFEGNKFGWEITPAGSFLYLFSPARGLFVWSPVFFIGLIGLIQKKMWLYLTTLATLWLVTSSNVSYNAVGFGLRYAFGAVPFFAFGIAHIIEKQIKNPLYLFIPTFVWNLTLLFCFYVLRLSRST